MAKLAMLRGLPAWGLGYLRRSPRLLRYIQPVAGALPGSRYPRFAKGHLVRRAAGILLVVVGWTART